MHGWFRTEFLRRAGLFPTETLQLFIALAVLVFYFLSLESSYRLFVCVFGAYGKSHSTV